MNLHNLTAQAKALAPVIRDFVKQATDKLRAELLESINSQLDPIRDDISKVVSLIDLGEIAKRAAELIPIPEKGEKGEPGDMAPVEAVQAMIDEAVAKAMACVEKPADGQPGAPGKDGDSVPVEDVQRMIDAAVAQAMVSVKMPADGQPGRDALDIEVLPDIDAAKSYQRGVFATHNGGIWRSYEKTHGMRGWECIARGFPDIRLEMRGERTLAVISIDSVGKEEIKTFSIPVMIYREVWKEGNTYQQGDTVSFGGSLWHCDASDVTDKPGVPGSRWTLCAKKGRDGKSS